MSRELVEKFSRRTELIEQRARDKYKVLEAEASALMKSTNMAFDDASTHVIAEIGGDWDKWKSNLGARNRESKSSAKYKVRPELVAHWQSEMTPEERESLQPKKVKAVSSQNLLGAGAAKELAIRHLFEQVSLKRELHIAGMLLRRGIARVAIVEALTWVRSDPLFVRPDRDGRLLTTRQVRGVFTVPKKAALPPEADAPVSIQKILDLANLETLKSLCDNPIDTRLQRACIYAELKKRRELCDG